MARILTEEYRAGAYSCVMHCFSSGEGAGARGLGPRFLPVRCRASRPFPKKPRVARDLCGPPPAGAHSCGDRQPLSRAAPPSAASATNPPIPCTRRAWAPGTVRPDRGRVRAAATTANFDRPLHPAPPPGGRRPEHGGTALHHSWLRIVPGACRASGGNWGDCDPEEPRNRRLRCSMLVQRFDEGRRDGGPDRHIARPAPAIAGRRHRAARPR